MNRKKLFSDLPVFGPRGLNTGVPFPKPIKLEKPKSVQEKHKKGLRKISLKRANKLKGRSEIDVFNEIWDERPHVSELSGKPLLPKGHILWFKQFLHVVNKGRFDSVRLDKRNILLGLPDEHDHQDRYDVFEQRKTEIMRELYK